MASLSDTESMSRLAEGLERPWVNVSGVSFKQVIFTFRLDQNVNIFAIWETRASLGQYLVFSV